MVMIFFVVRFAVSTFVSTPILNVSYDSPLDVEHKTLYWGKHIDCVRENATLWRCCVVYKDDATYINASAPSLGLLFRELHVHTDMQTQQVTLELGSIEYSLLVHNGTRDVTVRYRPGSTTQVAFFFSEGPATGSSCAPSECSNATVAVVACDTGAVIEPPRVVGDDSPSWPSWDAPQVSTTGEWLDADTLVVAFSDYAGATVVIRTRVVPMNGSVAAGASSVWSYSGSHTESSLTHVLGASDVFVQCANSNQYAVLCRRVRADAATLNLTQLDSTIVISSTSFAFKYPFAAGSVEQFTVVWQEDGTQKDVVRTVIAADGTIVAAKIRVDTFEALNQNNPCAARLADGSVATLWRSRGQDAPTGFATSIQMQVFDCAGDAMLNNGTEQSVSESNHTVIQFENPSVAAFGSLNDGVYGFVSVFYRDGGPNQYDDHVVARAYARFSNNATDCSITGAPTTSPTRAPSPSPTASPTPVPTSLSTPSPTTSPTSRPTTSPPSPSPTFAPTASASAAAQSDATATNAMLSAAVIGVAVLLVLFAALLLLCIYCRTLRRRQRCQASTLPRTSSDASTRSRHGSAHASRRQSLRQPLTANSPMSSYMNSPVSMPASEYMNDLSHVAGNGHAQYHAPDPIASAVSYPYQSPPRPSRALDGGYGQASSLSSVAAYNHPPPPPSVSHEYGGSPGGIGIHYQSPVFQYYGYQ